MEFRTLKLRGDDILPSLEELRYRYRTTGEYPFLIGDADSLETLKELPQFNSESTSSLIQASHAVRLENWIATRRQDMEADEISTEELIGEWPGEIVDKGSIGIHTDVLSGEILSEVYVGLANIEHPWQLAAVVKYGSWNSCPDPQVHCAFHRHWQEVYGAEIVSMSSDVIECTVRKPPLTESAAMALAWEQFWYCGDIVDQGCGSISNLAATLENSDYWYFWWD